MELTVVKLAILFGFFCFCGGSRIRFVKTHDAVTFGITADLTLRCSWDDDKVQSNSSSAESGRQAHKVIGQEVSSRDVSLTTNTEHALSIIVIKVGEKNETVASVVKEASPVKYMDIGRLQVQGNIQSKESERAYLELIWSRPDPGLDGTYECLINTMDAMGYPLSHRLDLHIDITQPSISYLIQRLWELEEALAAERQERMGHMSALEQKLTNASQSLGNDIQSVQSELNAATHELLTTKSELTAASHELITTKSELTAATHELITTKSELNTTQEQVASMTSAMSQLTTQHTEQGMVYCHEDDWKSASFVLLFSPTDRHIYASGKQCSQKVVFQRSYQAPPAILLSANSMHTYHSITTSDSSAMVGQVYEISVQNVTTEDFVILCSRSNEAGEYLHGINVYWLSTVKG